MYGTFTKQEGGRSDKNLANKLHLSDGKIDTDSRGSATVDKNMSPKGVSQKNTAFKDSQIIFGATTKDEPFTSNRLTEEKETGLNMNKT